MAILPDRPRGSHRLVKLAAVLVLLALVAGALVTVSSNALAQVGDPITPPPGDPPPQDPPPQDPPPEEPPPQQPPPEEQPPPPPQYPPVPSDSGVGRRIVYSQSQMRMWLVEDGEQVVGSWKVTGRRGLPKVGTYRVYSKSRWARRGKLRWEFMVRFARGRRLAIGMHSIPFTRRGPIQSEESLGTGVSGGCVRMARANAELVWNWAPIGTVVMVRA